jgi:hypothetical protein
MEQFVAWLREQVDERGGEYRAKADPHGGTPHVAGVMGMVAQAQADLGSAGLGEADLDNEATQSSIDLLDPCSRERLDWFRGEARRKRRFTEPSDVV